MNLHVITGNQEFMGKRSRKERRAKRREKGSVVKRIAQGAKKVAVAGFRGLNKLNPALVAGRVAALQLVRSNHNAVATKIYESDDPKIYKVWQNMGGDVVKMREAVNKGRSKGISFGVNSDLLVYDKQLNPDFTSIGGACYQSGIGLLPLAPALIAKAWAILVTLLPMLKKGEAKVEGSEGLTDELAKVAKMFPGETEVQKRIAKALDPESDSADIPGAGSGFDIKTLLPIAAVGAVLIFTQNK